MKRLFFIILFFLIFSLINFAQAGIFNNNSLIDIQANIDFRQDFFIDKQANIDKLNHIFDSLLNKKTNLDYPNVLHFSKVDAESIDSLFWCLHHKEFIKAVAFDSCNIKGLPLSLNFFENLNEITFKKCDSIISFEGFAPRQSTIGIYFDDCDLKQFPSGLSNLPAMLKLEINLPYNSQRFDINRELSRFVKRNNIQSLFIYSNLLDRFPDTLFSLTSLQALVIRGSKAIRYPDRFNELVNLRHLGFMTNTAHDKPQESASRNGVLMHSREFSDETTPADGIDPDTALGHPIYQMYYNEAKIQFEDHWNVVELVPSPAVIIYNGGVAFYRNEKLKDDEFTIGNERNNQITVRTEKNSSSIVISLPSNSAGTENCYAVVHYADGEIIGKQHLTGNKFVIDLGKITIQHERNYSKLYVTVLFLNRYYTFSLLIV